MLIGPPRRPHPRDLGLALLALGGRPARGDDIGSIGLAVLVALHLPSGAR
ncbi:MAG: hypothetical protein M0T80_15175 [Actinomycetota bacterium]|nr:hypothetical protein [Actinomycetota bacterium]